MPGAIRTKAKAKATTRARRPLPTGVEARMVAAGKALLKADKSDIASWISEYDPYFDYGGDARASCVPDFQNLVVRVTSPEGTELIVSFPNALSGQHFRGVRAVVNDDHVPNPSRKVLLALYRRLFARRAMYI